jgi:hypothetical protein
MSMQPLNFEEVCQYVNRNIGGGVPSGGFKACARGKSCTSPSDSNLIADLPGVETVTGPSMGGPSLSQLLQNLQQLITGGPLYITPPVWPGRL